MGHWTPAQERVMDKVYGRTIWGDDGRLVGQDPEHPIWIGPCGHPGSSMTVDAEGLTHCHIPLSEEHHDDPRSEDYYFGPHICGDRCKVVKCGRTYTEAEVFAFDSDA